MATPLHDGTRPAPVLEPPVGTLAPRAAHHRRPQARSGAHRLPRRHIPAAVRRIVAELGRTRTREPISPSSGG